jgi:sulfite reductase (NADPH) flavoprotein alpha-component
MTISIWRYSHLALAVSSFIFLILAAGTGIILAFQPVSQKMQPYKVSGFDQITLAEAIPAITKAHSEISALSIDANDFVLLQGSDEDGENISVFIDPATGIKLGVPAPENALFQWATNFHRSLFLKETGRFFVGLSAFILLLIASSGIILIAKRQRGIRRFFTKISKENFAQYYHVVLGRLSLIPILIIALSGTYLSMERFGLVKSETAKSDIDFDAIRDAPKKATAEFPIFKTTRLSDVQRIEFPFSDDVEDYFTLHLKDKVVTVNQVTGDILSEEPYPVATLITNLSLDLHTGRTSAVWAIILAIACVNILFFVYSGFAITLRRRANVTRNKYKADESRFVILVGSENGTTFQFAQQVHQQLLQKGEKSYLTEFNNYQSFPKAEYMVAMTATYGLGDPPTNAKSFQKVLEKHPQTQHVHYSVVGFGSHAYPDFCKFAFEVNQLLAHQPWAKPLVDVHTVNDKSPSDFALWAEAWAQQAGIPISVTGAFQPQKHNLEQFTVTANTGTSEPDGTFLVKLQGKDKQRVTSGDLLAIYPENDHRERLYSIGLVETELQLSVRLHPGGLGSQFLHKLVAGQTIAAHIVRNEHFHFPTSASQVIMIANGTGIAPFLGMISENSNRVPCHLYCGFRDDTALHVHHLFLEKQQKERKLSALHIAFSRQGEKQYVGDLLARDAQKIADILANEGVVMICGSLSMQKTVLELLEKVCAEHLDKSLSHFQSHGKILMDCY